MTYADWYTQYLALYKSDLRPRTIDQYNALSRAYILPALGAMPIAEITPEAAQRVLLDAAARAGARTAQSVFALLRAVLRRAVRSRLLPWSPIDALDRPRHAPAPGAAMSAADYAAALPHILADLPLALAMLAGLRRGEICGLRWGDVDLSARVIYVRRQSIRVRGSLIDQVPKSSAGVRCVPICADLLPLLRSAYRLAPQARVVTISPESISRRWRNIQSRDVALSRHYRLHDLRHTYVSRLLLAGAVPRVVQYVAGHASLQITMQTYAHVTPSDARAELDRLEALPTSIAR